MDKVDSKSNEKDDKEVEVKAEKSSELLHPPGKFMTTQSKR
jgi:hypothetical protein